MQEPRGGKEAPLRQRHRWTGPNERGQLLVAGLDMQTLGNALASAGSDGTRFHENHLFSHSQRSNLLIGRGWPGRAELRRCQRSVLSLAWAPSGPRIARLQRFVGETGWQLSHGERSRVFVARTLLQGAPLILLDESCAARSGELGAGSALSYGVHTLVVISHP